MYDSERSRTFALFLAELFDEMKEPKAGEQGAEGKNAVLADAVMSVLTMLCNEPLRNNRINLNAAADAIKVRKHAILRNQQLIIFFVNLI